MSTLRPATSKNPGNGLGHVDTVERANGFDQLHTQLSVDSDDLLNSVKSTFYPRDPFTTPRKGQHQLTLS